MLEGLSSFFNVKHNDKVLLIVVSVIAFTLLLAASVIADSLSDPGNPGADSSFFNSSRLGQHDSAAGGRFSNNLLITTNSSSSTSSSSNEPQDDTSTSEVDSYINVGGETIVLPEDGKVDETVVDDNGNETDVNVNVNDNSSSSSSDDDADNKSRLRINIDSDTDYDFEIDEEFKEEYND